MGINIFSFFTFPKSRTDSANASVIPAFHKILLRKYMAPKAMSFSFINCCEAGSSKCIFFLKYNFEMFRIIATSVSTQMINNFVCGYGALYMGVRETVNSPVFTEIEISPVTVLVQSTFPNPAFIFHNAYLHIMAGEVK